MVVDRDAVELVRREGEPDVVGAVEGAQCLKERAAEAGVSRRVSGKGRREIWPGQVARRCAEGKEARIARGVGIAVAEAGRAGPRVGLADAGHRAPELIEIL